MSDEIEEIQPGRTLAIENSELNESDSQTLRLSSAHQSAIPHFLYFLISSNQNTTVQPFKNLKESLDYLTNLKDPKKIIDDEQAVLALIEINDLFRKKKDQMPIIMESKLQMILKELLAYLYEILYKYVRISQFNIEIENTNSNFTSFHLIVELLEILIVSSKEFATTFHMISGTKIVLNYFENYILMNYLTKSFTNLDPFKGKRKINYCKTLSSLLNCLFYLKTARIQAFRELNAVPILIRFSNNLKFVNCELILRSHFVIAGLASRKQIESMPNIDFAILILEKTIQMFAQASQKKTKYTSYQFDLFYDNDMRSFEISTHDSPNTFIVHMLLVTEAFMVNDDIKYRVFNTIKNSLLILLIQGDLIEKYFSLNLFINFAYDDVLNEKIRRSSNVITLVDQILSQSPQLDENIKNSAVCLKSILNIKATCLTYRKSLPFNITKNILTTTSTTTITETSVTNTPIVIRENQILITYHESNELICMRIRNELENSGYDVDLIERKTANNLDIEKVIKTIERSKLIIACLSASFEYEKICQFEIIYAKRIGKLILPLNVHAKYKPDYWVEEVFAGSRILECKLQTVKRDMIIFQRDISLLIKIKQTSFENTNYEDTNNRTSQTSYTCSLL